MKNKHHTILHYIIGGAALCLAGYANVKPAPATVHESAVHRVQRSSRHDWQGLDEDKTIALGDALKGVAPGKAMIFCAEPSCHDLALDLDDAMQLADWKSSFEGRVVDGEAENGIIVGPLGPQGESLAAAVEKATGLKTKIEQIDGIDGVGIIIGKTGN